MPFTTVLKPEFAQRWRAAGEWRDDTFFDIVSARAAAHPEREVFVDDQGRITYGELKDKVERCAAFLRSIGIVRGDVVNDLIPISQEPNVKIMEAKALLCRVERCL